MIEHIFFRNVFIVVKDALHLTDGSARLKCQLPRRLPVKSSPFPKGVVTMYCCARVVGLAFPCLSGGIRAALSAPRGLKGVEGYGWKDFPLARARRGRPPTVGWRAKKKSREILLFRRRFCLFEVNIFVVLGSVAVCIRYLYVLMYFPEYWIIVRH